MSQPFRPHRTGFTLVELLMVIMLIGILTTFVLVALAGVTEKAKEDRTKAQIAKIHELIMGKWESYLYRKMPPTNYANNLALRVSRGQDSSWQWQADGGQHAGTRDGPTVGDPRNDEHGVAVALR